MNGAQKAIIASLIGTSAIAWIASIEQPDMMVAMTSYNPFAISLFTASWTAGMAAMMFPAIAPMVLLYNRFVANKEGKSGQSSVTVQEEGKPKSPSIRSLRVMLFTGSYLVVWALTGVALLLGWSVVMNNTIMAAGSSLLLPSIYGGLLIIAGAYQFTPLKRTCMGYCESPMSFFMRRWKDGTFGAVRMGVWHGMYCLGCCWAYFLLMVALGWMNLLWMGLFAGIIFGEKMWSRGIWVARAAGVGLVITGVLVVSGMLPSLVSSASSMGGDNTAMEMHVETENSGDLAMEMDAGNSMNMGSESSGTTSDGGDGGQSIQPPIDSSGSIMQNDMTMK